ncbi:MAG: tRNA (N6-threonylcarbamoyladenosine(37)-N6)-methyltransferase TrmO [Clostridiales bacterium]|nr:tRNA (N6-threonylcarbamoyladenosine(37)-N6)-methyltransferase TrmO [Clostridiales bacterium]
MEIKPIAYIKTDFKEKFGIPRQSGRAPSLTSEIIFEPEYRTIDALRAIEQFSHLWLIFDFSKAHKESWSATVRPPRLGGNERVGVFASRSPFRPNPIGLSCVKLERIEQRADVGAVLIVSGADLLDNTPIFDIKPYLPYADCHLGAVGGYADEKKDYRLQVEFPTHLLEKIPKDKQDGLLECLADDPRPSYQDDPTREYGMRFADFEIKFTVNADTLTVFDVFEVE